MAIKLTKELLDEDAHELAKGMSTRRKTTFNQIRKFYDDFLLLKEKGNNCNNDEFSKKIIPLIYFSKAKISYAQGRQDVKIDTEFAKEMKAKIDQIETRDDFENFILFYQAVIGFYKYEEMLGNRNNNNNSRRY